MGVGWFFDWFVICFLLLGWFEEAIPPLTHRNTEIVHPEFLHKLGENLE